MIQLLTYGRAPALAWFHRVTMRITAQHLLLLNESLMRVPLATNKHMGSNGGGARVVQ